MPYKKKTNKFMSFILLYDHSMSKSKNHQLQLALVTYQLKAIDKQIKLINKKYPNNEIIVCVGDKSDIIIDHINKNLIKNNIRIVENVDYVNNNDCESLRLCINNLNNNNIVIIDGPVVIPEKVFNKIKLDGCYVVVSKNKNNTSNMGANISEKEKIEHFGFGACQEYKNVIVMCNPRANHIVKKLLLCGTYKNKFILEAFNDLISLKYVVKPIEISEEIKNFAKTKLIKKQGKIYEVYTR